MSFRVLLQGGGVHSLSGKELRRTNPLLLLDYYEASMTVVTKQCSPLQGPRSMRQLTAQCEPVV